MSEMQRNLFNNPRECSDQETLFKTEKLLISICEKPHVVAAIDGEMRWLAWCWLARHVWMLRLMIVFWVQCLGAAGDVRAQAVSQPACPDILEPTGAVLGWVCQNNKLRSQHNFLNIFTYLTSESSQDWQYSPGRLIWVGEIMNGSKINLKWRLKSTNIFQHFRWGESQAQLQAPSRPTCPPPEIKNIWGILW